MKKNTDKMLTFMREFLTVFLPKQRKSSPHTILATKQVWNMLLLFVCSKIGKKVEKLTFLDFTQEIVTKFLDETQQLKNWSPATRNHRLARIRSFFRYSASIEPTMAIYLERLRNIPLQKDVNKSFVLEYMPKEAMAAVLRQPDANKKSGIRDQFYLVLMYDSAARNSEMLSLRFSDFDPAGKCVCLWGKGNKPRNVPISDNTIQHFHKYAKIYHPTGDGTIPMFYTVRKGKKGEMSPDNVARFLQQYSNSARAECPGVPDNTYPHMVRRSRAMHMYQAGMPLEILAQFLGHDDPLTTLVYARADNEMKRKAIEKVAALTGLVEPEAEEAIWEDNDEMIKRLLGLS